MNWNHEKATPPIPPPVSNKQLKTAKPPRKLDTVFLKTKAKTSNGHASNDSSIASLGSNYEGHTEKDRLNRNQKLAQLRQERTEKAESEAHEKDESILKFETTMLGPGPTTASINTTKSTPSILGFSPSVAATNAREEEGCSKQLAFKYLVLAVAWWDLIMTIVTCISFETEEILIESITRDGFYNCFELTYEVGSSVRWIYMIHGLSSFLLQHSLSSREANLMILWFITKAIILIFFGFRHAFDMRPQDEERIVSKARVYFILVAILFYITQYVIVIIAYLMYTKPIVERRRKLQSSRPLNRDIYIKSLTPFMQRKYALRWAEKLQTTIVLQKIRERNQKRNTRNDTDPPTDEQLAQDVENGIREFTHANHFEGVEINFGDAKSRRSRMRASRRTAQDY